MESLKKFSICHLNVRSLFPKNNSRKLDKISVLYSEYAFDVIAMSETCLESSILNTNISLPCYGEPHRLDRNRSGGDVLAFVKSNIYCIRRFDLERPNVEGLWLVMCREKSISFILAACYQPKFIVMGRGTARSWNQAPINATQTKQKEHKENAT